MQQPKLYMSINFILTILSDIYSHPHFTVPETKEGKKRHMPSVTSLGFYFPQQMKPVCGHIFHAQQPCDLAMVIVNVQTNKT